LRCRVVRAKGASCPPPVAGYPPAGVAGPIDCRLDLPRTAWPAYGRSPSSFGVGAYPVQNSSRCLERGRWALLFAIARFGRHLSRRVPSFRQSPRRVSARRAGAPHEGGVELLDRGCWPPSSRVNAHWRSLNQDVPTSDVLCRLAGTTRWLQATSSLPRHPLLVSRRGNPGTLDLPERPGPPRARRVKGERPTTQDAFHRIETSSRAFAMRTQYTRSSGRIRAPTCAPVRQSWSLADSCQYLRTIPLSVRRFHSS